MNLKKITIIFVLALLFSSCSERRFGHLSKVKSNKEANLKSNRTSNFIAKNIEEDSIKIEVKNFEIEDVFLKIKLETKKEELISPKTKLKYTKIPIEEKIIASNNIVTKQEIKAKTYNNPEKNQNARNAFIYGLLALFLPVIAVVAMVTLYFSLFTGTFPLYLISILILVIIAAFICAFQAFRLGIKGLNEINQGNGYNRGEAIFGIVIGGLYLLSILSNLFK